MKKSIIAVTISRPVSNIRLFLNRIFTIAIFGKNPHKGGRPTNLNTKIIQTIS